MLNVRSAILRPAQMKIMCAIRIKVRPRQILKTVIRENAAKAKVKAKARANLKVTGKNAPPNKRILTSNNVAKRSAALKTIRAGSSHKLDLRGKPTVINPTVINLRESLRESPKVKAEINPRIQKNVITHRKEIVVTAKKPTIAASHLVELIWALD